jgi:hypothetical protein
MAVRVVQGATSSGTSQVAPVARSVCALLLAIGVPDAHLDGVMAVLSDPERFPEDQVPRNMQEIAAQARRGYEMYMQDILGQGEVVDAATSV